MTDKIVFAFDNRFDNPSICADNQVQTLPAANVQSKQRREVWRTTDTGGSTGHHLIVPFDAEEFIEGFFMTNYNFSVDATYEIRAVTDAVSGGTVTVTSGSASVTKSGGPAWTSLMDGADFVYQTGTAMRTVPIQSVAGPDALTLSANAPSSYTGTDYTVLDFKNAYDSVNFPQGYQFATGSVVVWKSLWGAGEDRCGFHGAGGYPTSEDLKFIRPIEMNLFSVSQEYRYWKINFFDSGNTDGFLEVGRMFLGPLFRPTRNFNANFRISPFNDPSQREDSMGQVIYSDTKQKFGEIQLKFDGLDASEAQTGFAYMQNVVGLTRDFFVSLEPDQSVSNWFYTTFYGRLSREMALSTSRINSKLRDIDFNFQESL